MSCEEYVGTFQRTPAEFALKCLKESPFHSPHWYLRIECEAFDQLVVDGIAIKEDGCWMRGPGFVRPE